MSKLLKLSIVRIQKENGNIVGAGFLIEETQVVTCAHVVKKALGIPSKQKQVDPPGGDIILDFPFCETEINFKAKVEWWSPTREDGGLDIAGLVLTGFPPRDARSIPLCTDDVDKLQGFDFDTFGYPEGIDAGEWSSGIVVDERADRLIQLVDIKVTGRRIEKGFSGGPVWVKKLQKVIGMVSIVDKKAEAKVAFMIPAKMIIDVCKVKPLEEDIKIPIVIAAMTRSEAEYLIKNDNGNKEFNDLKENFTKDDISSWLSHYDDDRDNWKPHSCSEVTICNIVGEIIEGINLQERLNPNQKMIRPNFVSKGFFDEKNKATQDEIWVEIGESGGVVIIDAISLFHPKIREIFRDSGIASHKEVSLIGINPLNIRTIKANKLIDDQTYSCMRVRFNRFADFFEESCEFGVSNLRAIERWLYNILQKTSKFTSEYQSNPDTRMKFRRQSRNKPRGFGNLIASGGVRQ